MRPRTVITGLGFSLLLGFTTVSPRGQQPSQLPPNPFAQLHFRFVGPTGNRAAAVAGEPGNPSVIYVGAASGGIWKSTNGGVDFHPIFDRADVAAMGMWQGDFIMTSSTRTLIRSLSWAAALAATAVLLAGTPQAQAPPGGASASNPFRQLHFRFIGPMGGRVAAITGVPGEPGVAYIGSADGGIFKTSDYATTWRPIFNHEHTGAIGALAVAPSAHNIVWAGTGEPWVIRAAPDLGDGVYRSTDSGRSWTHMGLDATGHVANIAIDPHDANVVYVCAVGQFYRTQPERGVFKTADGGRTWQKVLFVDEQTGCSDLAMDPHDPDTLFAGMWQVTVHTWDLHSGGPSSGLYVTHDAGAHWAKSTGNGLPSAGEALGRVSVKVAPTDSRRVYALFEQHPPGFYRSDNGGRTWHLVSHSYALGGRMPYDSRFGVSSGDENLLYFLGTRWAMSRDGGETLVENPLAAGSDLHNIWMDPDNPNHYMVSDDTGGSITWNGGTTYNHIILPNAQLYHAYPDRRIPYRVFANKQDGGSMVVPSNNLDGPGGIGYGDLFHAAACESGFVVPDSDGRQHRLGQLLRRQRRPAGLPHR